MFINQNDLFINYTYLNQNDLFINYTLIYRLQLSLLSLVSNIYTVKCELISISRKMQVYPKEITASDAGDRLYVSSKRLDDGFYELRDGERSREVVAFDAKGELPPWRFHLRIRAKGPYRKPVISGDWLNFVREKNVQVGDTVVFFKEYYYDQATGTEMMRYKIGVKIEEIELFGKLHAVVR